MLCYTCASSEGMGNVTLVTFQNKVLIYHGRFAVVSHAVVQSAESLTLKKFSPRQLLPISGGGLEMVTDTDSIDSLYAASLYCPAPRCWLLSLPSLVPLPQSLFLLFVHCSWLRTRRIPYPRKRFVYWRKKSTPPHFENDPSHPRGKIGVEHQPVTLPWVQMTGRQVHSDTRLVSKQTLNGA